MIGRKLRSAGDNVEIRECWLDHDDIGPFCSVAELRNRIFLVKGVCVKGTSTERLRLHDEQAPDLLAVADSISYCRTMEHYLQHP